MFFHGVFCCFKYIVYSILVSGSVDGIIKNDGKRHNFKN